MSLSVLLISLGTSCSMSIAPIETGMIEYEYISENEYISAAKLFITEITKEEYDNGNNLNVIIDASTRNDEVKRYLRLELYLYSTELELYVPVKVYNITYEEGSKYFYRTSIQMNIGTLKIDGTIKFNLGHYNAYNYTLILIENSEKGTFSLDISFSVLSKIGEQE